MRNFDPIITCVPATLSELPTSDRHFHIDNFDYTAAGGQSGGTPGGGGEGQSGTAVGGGEGPSGTPGGGGEGANGVSTNLLRDNS